MKLVKRALLLTLASTAVWAQVNIGEQKPEASMPFTMTSVATFKLPWRLAFLPDGRILCLLLHEASWPRRRQGVVMRFSDAAPLLRLAAAICKFPFATPARLTIFSGVSSAWVF